MAKKKRKSITMAPFSVLEWSDYSWETKVQLVSWSGFQDRSGAYASQGSDKKSDGTVEVSVSGEVDSQPTAEQAAAFSYLVKHQKPIQKVLLQTIFEAYPKYRSDYIANYGIDEADCGLPILKRYQQLKDLIGFSSLLIHEVSKDGTAYVGYEFGCAWEEEHGLGAMLHMDRIVKIGHADVGILEWIAKDDAKPRRNNR